MAQHIARPSPAFDRSPASAGTGLGSARLRHLPLRTLLGAALVLVFILAGCGGGGGSATGTHNGGTLNVGLDSDVVTLDPLKSSA
ncbi:MAG: hypothetical protein ACRDHP_17745, partial [Ktedonobacterales bacterium]